jgi:hypothetical protein
VCVWLTSFICYLGGVVRFSCTIYVSQFSYTFLFSFSYILHHFPVFQIMPSHTKLAQKSRKPFEWRFGGPAPRPRPQRHDNGFLDLNNVPPQVAAAKSLKNRHPLFSVGPICNIIYDFLLANIAVEIYTRPHPLGHDTIQTAHGRPISVDGITLNPHISLFRTLPLASRKFYNETSALLYSRVPFYFEFTPNNVDRRTMETWAEGLLPYQRVAVRTVEPFWYLFYKYFIRSPLKPLHWLFPSLQRIIVPHTICMCECMYLFEKGQSQDIAAPHVIARIRQRETRGVVIDLSRDPAGLTAVQLASTHMRTANRQQHSCHICLGEMFLANYYFGWE